MADINNFIRLCGKDYWGVVSWHLPHCQKPEGGIINVFPPEFSHIADYVPRYETEHTKPWRPDPDASSFAMLVHEGGELFSLKVNRRGWGKAKDHIMGDPQNAKEYPPIYFEYDNDKGPCLKATRPIDIVQGKLRIIEYRIHLTVEDKGLRDMITWEDIGSTAVTKPQYLTAYVWCFLRNGLKPFADSGDRNELADADFDKALAR